MLKSAVHYIRRSRQLGPFGTVCRVGARIITPLVIWSQVLWWGWKARLKMSDNALLARTTGDWPSVESLLNHLARRPASSFLLPHESSEETAFLLNKYYPEYVSDVLAAADAVCRNELNLLGQVFHFPQGIDWHCDPLTGWRWPLLHRIRMGRYLGSAQQEDLILIWRLNRHQHFIILGIAYWLTRETKYLETFCSQMQGWIESNPLQHGINWYDALEVSIRLIAWTAAFQFFCNSPEFREKLGKDFLKSLWQQVDFLNSHLQNKRSDVPNNHIIAELTGLVIIGTAFPEFRAAATWRDTGLRMLNQQVLAQTHPDGVNKEQATGYHHFVAELLLLIVARSRQGVLPNVPVLDRTLEHMLDYMLFSLTPVKTAPQWGDSDNGNALGLGLNKDFWDFRPILSAGVVLFGRPEWKFAAGRYDEEAFWLLGSAGLDLWQNIDANPPTQTSRAFPQSGMYVMRDAWTSQTDVAFFRCGPFGLGGEKHCAHSHCDLLSFTLWVNGQPLLVDSGTFIYHGPWRDYFRLSAAHNTVTVDDLDQAVPMPNFNWQQISEGNCSEWTEDRVSATLNFPNQVNFTRQLVHTQQGAWELIDEFTSHAESHKITWFFHFAEGLTLRWIDSSANVMVEHNGKPFAIVYLPKGVRIEIKSGWVSRSYGIKEPNSILAATWEGQISSEGVSFCWKLMSDKEIRKEK